MRRRRCLAPVLLASPSPGSPSWPLRPRRAAAQSEADRLWLVGAGAFEDGLYETAYRELGRFVQAAPTDPRRGDAALLRGKAAFSMERYAEALTEFDAAETFPLTVAPTPGEAIFWQGEALFRLRRLRGGAGPLRAVPRRSSPRRPYVPEALYARGLAELEAGRADSAVDTFRDFLRDYPNHARAPTAAYSAARELIRAKRWDDALALLGPYAEPLSRRAPTSRRRAISSGSPSWRPAGPRACGRSSSSSPSRRAASSSPTARVLVAEAQAKAGPEPRGAGAVPGSRPGGADPRARAPGALPDRRALAPAEPARGRGGRLDHAPARLPAERAGRAGGARHGAAPRAAEAVGAGAPGRPVRRRSRGARSAPTPSSSSGRARCSFAGTPRPRRPTMPWSWSRRRPPSATSRGWRVSPPRSRPATDKEGAKRAYREIVDTSQDPELVRWAKGRLATLEAPAAAAAGGSAPRSQAQAQGTREVMRGFR